MFFFYDPLRVFCNVHFFSSQHKSLRHFESFAALFFIDTLVKLYFTGALVIKVLKGLCVFSGRTRKLAWVNDAVCFLCISRFKYEKGVPFIWSV